MMMLMMEGAEQDYEEGGFGYKDHQSQMMIMKGKRTKRQRLNSPLAALATTASSSSSAGHEDQEHHQEHQEGLVFGPRAGGISISSDVGPAASPPTSADQSTTEISTEEEEDMANCLILLAQGKSTPQPQYPKLVINNNKASVLPSAAAGSYVYKCKTCDRCFHSFQALGGHRASHKKEKNINHTQENNRKALSFVEEAEEFDRFNSTTLSLQISNRDYRSLSSAATTVCHSNNKANKVHECSVCGAEFTSGQALGGHMRRHRTFNSTTTAAVNMSPPQSQSVGSKRPRDMLQLDLNLPAPEEERVDNKFPFGSKKEQVIVFSASPLVGCHY